MGEDLTPLGMVLGSGLIVFMLVKMSWDDHVKQRSSRKIVQSLTSAEEDAVDALAMDAIEDMRTNHRPDNDDQMLGSLAALEAMSRKERVQWYVSTTPGALADVRRHLRHKV